jgi:hypothetical protein
MAEINKPDGMNKIWASAAPGGNSVMPSDSKIAAGWIAEKPPFQTENALQNKRDVFNAHINQHGFPTWDSVTEYQANKSFIISGLLVYKCILTHTNQEPPNATYWTEWGSIASQAEVNAGTNTNKIVTPATLEQRRASTSSFGLIELATTAEVQAGVATEQALTPANIQNLTATVSRIGLAAIASQSEVDNGTGITKFVSPEYLKNGYVLDTGIDGAITLPSFLGGLKVIWGSASVSSENVLTVTFPDGGFTTAVYCLIATDTNVGALVNGQSAYPVVARVKSVTEAEFVMKGAVGTNQLSYIAIGK